MRRFFLTGEDPRPEKLNQVITLSGPVYNHAVNSLRHREGDRIELVDGSGRAFTCEIVKIDSETLDCRVLAAERAGGEPEVEVYLAQALAKKDNFELVLQKATEIGARAFYPLTTSNTVVELSSSRAERRLRRWEKIIREAARQSERGIVPELLEFTSIKELTEEFAGFDLVLLAAARCQESPLRRVLQQFGETLSAQGKKETPRIMVLIGPEGGFTPSEIDDILAAGENVQPVSLGPRILRTETAGPLLTGLILYELGEME